VFIYKVPIESFERQKTGYEDDASDYTGG